MSQEAPFTPLANLRWIRWIDRTGVPAPVLGVLTFLLFLPFYDFNALPPRLPFQAAGFPAVLALSLTFFLFLTRGAVKDLSVLVFADKIDTGYIVKLAAGPRAAVIELLIGLALGSLRVYSQMTFEQPLSAGLADLASVTGVVAVASVLAYTVVEIHLLAFCFRQVMVFRSAALNFKVDLIAPELNNALSNPLIRFIMLGFIAISFGVLFYQAIPFPSIQLRLVQSSALLLPIWFLLLSVSLIPLIVLKRRIAVAKTLEINLIRRALLQDFSGSSNSVFGDRLGSFSPADLMYYEDRIRQIWEWPVESHIRRLLLFGLLPPLTWVLAALVEVIFENMLAG